MPTIEVKYIGDLKDAAGIEEETVGTKANTAAELYTELWQKHELGIGHEEVKVSINGRWVDFEANLNDYDTVVFTRQSSDQ